jgi:peptidoglycan/LPS O-acetylase OafA/YrhL
MSSANTVLHTASTIAVRDVWPGPLGAVASARVATATIALAGLGLALFGGESILAPFRLGYTVYSAGLSLPVLAAFLPERVRPAPRWVLAAMAAGGGAAIAVHALSEDPSDLAPVAAGLALSASALAIGTLSRSSSRPGRDSRGLPRDRAT